jgi:D-alanyl-D-alanine carboxypeptidase
VNSLIQKVIVSRLMPKKMRPISTRFVLLVWMALLSCLPTTNSILHAQTPPDRISGGLQRILDQGMTATRSKGGIMMVEKPGEWSWKGAYGTASIRGRAATPDMRFYAGSITKNLVATAFLRLASQNKINLNDSIGAYLRPTLADTIQYFTAINIKQLLQHTSGIASYTNTAFALDFWNNRRAIRSPEMLLGYIKDSIATFPPATDPNNWDYSNTNFLLLALILEKVTGQDFHQYMTDSILKPAMMARSIFPPADETDLLAQDMACILNDPTTGIPLDLTSQSMSWAFGAGDLIATLEDLITYYKAVHAQQFFGANELEEMRESYVSVPDNIRRYNTYGLGIMVMVDDEFRAEGHGGNLFGNTSGLYYYPFLDVYIAFNFNNYPFAGIDELAKPTYELLKSVAASIQEAHASNISSNLFPNPSTTQSTLHLQLKQPERLSITLYNAVGQSIQTVLSGDVLTPGQHALPINVAPLPAGIYQVLVEGEAGKTAHKLVVQ